MTLKIILYGNKLLRTQCSEIEKNTNVKELVNNMFITMKESSGIGLAAPQIGKNIKLFIANFDDKRCKNIYYTKKLVAINPEISFPEEVKVGGVFFRNKIVEESEGCLSIPYLSANIKRKEYVKIKYYDENWNYKEEIYNGLPAVVIQHETDHLYGKLYTDYVENKTAYMEKILEGIEKGNIVPNYEYVPNI